MQVSLNFTCTIPSLLSSLSQIFFVSLIVRSLAWGKSWSIALDLVMLQNIEKLWDVTHDAWRWQLTAARFERWSTFGCKVNRKLKVGAAGFNVASERRWKRNSASFKIVINGSCSTQIFFNPASWFAGKTLKAISDLIFVVIQELRSF